MKNDPPATLGPRTGSPLRNLRRPTFDLQQNCNGFRKTLILKIMNRHRPHIPRTAWIGIFFIAALVGYALSLPRPLFDTPYSTVLYARGGELLGARVAADGQWRFPPGHDLPEKYVRAVVEYEDRRFFRHAGVSLPAVVRAVRQNVRAGRVVSGGSTLTMQLVRLSRGNPPRTVGEKLWEMLLATRVEWSYTKDEILGLYAAHAPFGGNVVGLEAAAWRYFGHDSDQLSWAEAATLAVLPNAPAAIHPGRGRRVLQAKRDRLLVRLLRTGAIDSAEYRAALIEPLPEAPEPLPRHAPHLLDRLPAGTVLHATLDNVLQQRVQQIADSYGERTLAANRIRNAAVLVADVRTGEVLAYVGNITPSTAPAAPAAAGDGRSVDLVRARRSTGSLLKPLLYAALLHEGQMLPRTLVLDTPLDIAGFTPSNYSRTFSGVVPADQAVARSLNVPIVRMLTRYHTGRFLALLRSLGLTTFDRSADDYGATLILGGAECTLWEMTGLYASLARSLETHNRTGHYESEDMRPLSVGGASESAFSGRSACPLAPAALWYMFEAMSGVNRPEEEAAWQEFGSMKRIAWKTGTSYGNRDAWAVGLTPRHAVGVWVGNADGEGRAAMTGVGYAAPILFDVFSLLPAAEGWFPEPADDMESAAVCRRSGHRASPWCGSSGDPVDTVSIPRAGVASPLCPYHRPFAENGSVRGWFVLPPAAEYYYRQVSSDYAVPPVAAGDRPLELIYPEPHAVLYLPEGFAGRGTATAKFVFRAAHRSDRATIHWHMDNLYLGSTRSASAAGHALAVAPEAGEHRLTIVDDEGYRQQIRFTVLTRN